MIARSAAGVAQVTAPQDALTGGYSTTDYQESGSAFSRSTVEADNVDGEYEVERHATNRRLTWQVLVTGSTPAVARARHTALLDAVQSGTWLLDVFGDGTSLVWTCDAADEEPPRIFIDGSRLVTLSIPAKPRRGY